MSVEAILAVGRKRRELLMRSTCTITRPGGPPVFDPATGTYTTPAETVIYSGKCQVKPTFSPAERVGESSGRELVIQTYDVIIPWNAAPAADVADVVTVTASDDAWVVGKRLPVGWVEHADSRTARHLTVFAQDRTVVTHA